MPSFASTKNAGQELRLPVPEDAGESASLSSATVPEAHSPAGPAAANPLLELHAASAPAAPPAAAAEAAPPERPASSADAIAALLQLPVKDLLREWRSGTAAVSGAELDRLMHCRAELLCCQQIAEGGWSFRQLYYEFLMERQGLHWPHALYRAALTGYERMRDEVLGDAVPGVCDSPNSAWILARLDQPFYRRAREHPGHGRSSGMRWPRF